VAGVPSNHSDKNETHVDSKTIVEVISKHKGSLVKQKLNYFLVSFGSVTNAVRCAIEIEGVGQNASDEDSGYPFAVKMGLSAGVPVTEKERIFEDTIKTAERLSEVVKGRIVMTSEVRDLYESENFSITIDTGRVNVLSPEDEKFLTALMDYIDKEWNSKSLT